MSLCILSIFLFGLVQVIVTARPFWIFHKVLQPFFSFFFLSYLSKINIPGKSRNISIFDDNLLSFRLKSLILDRRYFKSSLFLSINVFKSNYETFNNKASFQIFQLPFLFRDVFSQVARLPLTFIKLNLIDQTLTTIFRSKIVSII